MRAIQFDSRAQATRERRGQVAQWRRLARVAPSGWSDATAGLHTFAAALVFLLALGVV